MRERLRYMILEITPAIYPVLGLVVLALGLAVYAGHWVIWASFGSFVAIGLGRALTVLVSGGRAYTVGPLTVIWDPGADYVPREVYAGFLHEQWYYGRWEPHNWAISFLLDGSQIRYVPDKPNAPDIQEGKLVIRSVHGYTYPEARKSVVWDGGVVDMGTDGWELDLQAAHKAWGDKPEPYDHKQFKKLGIR